MRDLTEIADAVDQLLHYQFGIEGTCKATAVRGRLHISFEGKLKPKVAKPKPHDVNARSLVQDLLRQGLTRKALAKQLGVNRTTIYCWEHKGARPRGHAARRLKDLHYDRVMELEFVPVPVAASPGLTADQIDALKYEITKAAGIPKSYFVTQEE